MDGHYLEGILNNLTAEEGGICAHGDYVLVVVVVGDAVNVIWHGKGLALCRSGSCGELAGLHSVIEAQFTHVQERRQDAIDAVMEEVVELPFSEHGEAHKGNLHLVFLQGDVVSVEVSAVVHVLGVRIHNGVVAGRVNLVLKYF